MDFENELALGVGIYTPAEIAGILRLPKQMVNRWISTYWDGELGKEYESRYSWKTGNSKAVGFHTLIEFYVMMRLGEKGVKTRQVLQAHKELSKIQNTPFPFANKEVLEAMEADGRNIFFKINGHLITLDGTRQLNLDIIRVFFQNLDFDQDNIASKYWPLGRDRSIVIDPERKFGHAVFADKNIYPETLYGMYKAGEPKPYIAHLYEIPATYIEDAIAYCNTA